ncbi:excalibur calcium-binding domain-containing protein [Streptosporangium sp. NPDC006007]|uniref:excalibur calcium-binding domain-containing protein n=1 Tax=Streptosporangium sp. NPDC006007 TaxID=3154575 RepID=UPI0033BE1A8C
MLTAGVLGTLAVLMTRDPDMPLGAAPPRRLAVPIHFAPVTGSQAGPCTAPDALPDDPGQTCYTLAAGVSVNAVRKIEAVREQNGAYSVRIAFAPAFRDQINDLTQEAVRQQIAIVVGEKVVAAPRVAQVITEDSLSIAGSFTREQADAMVARLLGAAGTAGSGTSPSTQPSTPGGTEPTGALTPPAVTPVTGTPATDTTRGASQPAATSTARGDGGERRYPDCATAVKNGYGPYFKEIHKQYKWYVDRDGDGVACDPGDL